LITSIRGLLEQNKNLTSGKTEEEMKEELQRKSLIPGVNNENPENIFNISEQEGIEAFLTYISKKLDNII
jgi:hypothetical protein